jgi:hypothetical protein
MVFQVHLSHDHFPAHDLEVVVFHDAVRVEDGEVVRVHVPADQVAQLAESAWSF